MSSNDTRIGARALGGLLAVAVVASAAFATNRDSGDKLAVGGGALPVATPSTGVAAPTVLAAEPAPTVAPRARTPATTARRSTRTTSPAAVAALARTDTGLTRVRLAVENQASWATISLAGTQIQAARVVAENGARITSLGPDIGIADTGQAAVELVLKVPEGAAPSLTICKNSAGSTKVTLDRLTDGTTTIASLVNELHNTQTSGCENQLSTGLTRTVLMGPTRWPARNDARRLVLAHYYPWFDAATLNHDFGDRPTGPTDTSTASGVADAVALAAANGIDGFVVEWEASSAYEPRIDHVFNTADARSGFNVALMIDFEILKGRFGKINASILDTALGAMASRAGHPSQLKVGNQPVLMLFGSHLVTLRDWSAALGRLSTRTGVQPFVVADSPQLNAPGRHQYSSNNQGDLERLLHWAGGLLVSFRAEPGLVGANGPLWVGPVSPGHDDRRIAGRTHTYVDRANGTRFDDSWAAALATLPDWIVVTSWNEYNEQTHVMPGDTTGRTALDRLAAWAARFHAAG